MTWHLLWPPGSFLNVDGRPPVWAALLGGAGAGLLWGVVASRCEPRLPAPNGLVGDVVAPLEQQLGDISEAELATQPPEHREQHDVCRVVELAEVGAGSLVEPPPAGAAAEPAVAELSAVSPWGYRARSTVRTGHGQLLVLVQTRLPRARPEI